MSTSHSSKSQATGPQDDQPSVVVPSSEAQNTLRVDPPASAEKVDQPHFLGKGISHEAFEQFISEAPDPAADQPAELGLGGGQALEQIRVQAAQIATYLRQHRKELDQREAQLNARTANIENEIRSARVHASAQEEETSEARRQLEEERLQFESDKQRARLAMQQQADDLTRRQEQLEQRASQIEGQIKRHHESAQQNSDRLGRIDEDARLVKTRHEVIDEIETELRSEMTKLRESQSEFEFERKQTKRVLRFERESLVARERRMTEEIRQEKEKLQQRETDINRQQAVLEKLHEEIVNLHRNALEMRLAAEEVWNGLCADGPTPAMIRELEKTRESLAHQQRWTETRLQRKTDEIRQLSGHIAVQHGELENYQQQLQQWAKQSEEVYREKMASLAERTERLDERQDRFSLELASWQEEKARLESEIRRLKLILSEVNALV